jgi:Asp-tRNA(Asn)/Glu-tRNA(Gln) amidotransferase C subunit
MLLGRRFIASSAARCAHYTLPTGKWSLINYKALVKEQNNVISDDELHKIYRLACIKYDGPQEEVKKDINFMLNCIKVIDNEKVSDYKAKFPKQTVNLNQLRSDTEILQCSREDLFKNAARHVDEEYFIVPKRVK